jgi:SSS family solute:Na+ symporter
VSEYDRVWSASMLSAISRGSGWPNWVVLGGYLAVLVGVGIYFAKREKSTEDFFLAGRRIPWWAAGLSIFGTQLSAITYLAMPARAYATDWSLLPLNIGILLIAPIVIYIYLPLFRSLNVTTAYEYLEKRFHVSIRVLGSLSFVAFQLGRMGIVILLPALALSAVTGANVYLCIALIGLLSTVYTALGGMEAVIWTDVLQAVVLIGGAQTTNSHCFILAGIGLATPWS